MEKILVPTDFSEEANNALHAAQLIARKCNAELTLIHIIDANFDASFNVEGEIKHGADMDDVFVMKLMGIAKDRLSDIVNRDDFKDLKVNYEVKVGNPFQNIFKKINDLKADLVIMGTAGTSGLEEVLVGSNTEKVVRLAECPVLSLRTKIDDASFKNIVFATDMSDNQEAIIDELKEFKDVFGSKIHLLHVNTPNSFQSDRITKEQMKRFADKYGINGDITFNIYNDAVEEDGIMNFAQEIDADMIAMATHGRRGLSHLFSGSIAEDVVNHAKRPVLTFNMKKSK